MVFLGGHLAKYYSHQPLCVQCQCVCVCTVCLAFIIAAHLGNEVIFNSYQLSPLTPQITVNSGNATHIILRPHVLETTYRFEKWISDTPPMVRREPVTSGVTVECVSHSATVNQRVANAGICVMAGMGSGMAHCTRICLESFVLLQAIGSFLASFRIAGRCNNQVDNPRSSTIECWLYLTC